MANNRIKISELPPFVGSNVGAGVFPMSIGGTTFKVSTSQLLTYNKWYDENDQAPVVGPSAPGLYSIAMGDGTEALDQDMFVYGREAGKGALNAQSSNFLGYFAGKNAQSAFYSNFLGNSAGLNATFSSYSNYLGYFAGKNAGNASYSTFIGYKAGMSVTGSSIGSNNVVIGNNISLPNGYSNRVNMGGVLYIKDTSTNLSGDPITTPSIKGKVGINVIDPTANLHIAASGTASSSMRFDIGTPSLVKNDGDMWLESNTITGLKMQIGGTAYSMLNDDVDIFNKFQKKQNLPTGYIAGLTLSINVDPTKFDIGAGAYTITNFSDLNNIDVEIIQSPAIIGIDTFGLTSSNATYVALDQDQNVIQQNSPFDNADRRVLCLVGAVIHSNHINNNVVNRIVAPIIAPTNQLHDFIKAVGFLNLNGNQYLPNGANLQLNKTAGQIWGLGINGGNIMDPHRLTLGTTVSTTFNYRLQNGTEYSATQSVDPLNYDLNGVKTAVPNNRWTIQHINIFQSGLTRLQYGQTLYNSFAAAQGAVFIENFNVESNIADNSIFRAYLIIKKQTTNLTADIASGDAAIITVDKFGNAAGGPGSAVTYAGIVAALGYVPENEANKVTTLSGANNTTYPTTLAVQNAINSATTSMNLQQVTNVGATTSNFTSFNNGLYTKYNPGFGFTHSLNIGNSDDLGLKTIDDFGVINSIDLIDSAGLPFISPGIDIQSLLGNKASKINLGYNFLNLNVIDNGVGTTLLLNSSYIYISTTASAGAQLRTNGLSTDRDFYFPNQSGTFSLTSDLASVTASIYNNIVKQTVTNGVTSSCPSQDAVYDFTTSAIASATASITTPSLQQVTNVGNTTTNNVTITGTLFVNSSTGGNSIRNNNPSTSFNEMRTHNSQGVELLSSSNTTFGTSQVVLVDEQLYIQSSKGSTFSRLSLFNDRIGLRVNNSVYSALIKTDLLSDDRTFQFPDSSGTLALTSDLIPLSNSKYVLGINDDIVGNIITPNSKGVGTITLTNGSTAIIGNGGVDFTDDSNINSPFYWYEITVRLSDGTFIFIELDSYANATNGTLSEVYSDNRYEASVGSTWPYATGNYEYWVSFISYGGNFADGFVALNRYNFAGGDQSLVAGYNSQANGFASIGLGQQVIASASNSIAIGNNVVASAVGAIAIGSSDFVATSSSGVNSIAIGNRANASGYGSICISNSGGIPGALGTNSFCLGDSITVAEDSFIFGLFNQNTDSAIGSAIIGRANVANGYNSTILGVSNISNAYSETVVGHHSEDILSNNSLFSTTASAFRVGIGNPFDDRKDGLRIYNNGAMYLAPTASTTVANGANGFIIYNDTDKRLSSHNGTTWSSYVNKTDLASATASIYTNTVNLTGNQGINGIKTFNDTCVFGGATCKMSLYDTANGLTYDFTGGEEQLFISYNGDNIAQFGNNIGGGGMVLFNTNTNSVNLAMTNITGARNHYFVDKSGDLPIVGYTAPSSATDTGVKGEIRITSTFIYTCIATNTWVRSVSATW